MSNTIILQSEDVLVIEQETASIVEAEVQTVLTVESPEYGIVETEVETVLLVESEITVLMEAEVETVLVVQDKEITVLMEAEVETVLVVQDKEIIVLEASEQGPPGIPGPVGGTPIAGVIDYIWTGQQLDRIDLPDGTYKLFTYAAGKILRLDHVQTGQTVRKDYVWVGEVLESIGVSIL